MLHVQRNVRGVWLIQMLRCWVFRELSEGINSMWRYYRMAEICLVFLPDYVSDISDGEYDVQQLISPHCRWFQRGWITSQDVLMLMEPANLVIGWTLEELLPP